MPSLSLWGMEWTSAVILVRETCVSNVEKCQRNRGDGDWNGLIFQVREREKELFSPFQLFLFGAKTPIFFFFCSFGAKVSRCGSNGSSVPTALNETSGIRVLFAGADYSRGRFATPQKKGFADTKRKRNDTSTWVGQYRPMSLTQTHNGKMNTENQWKQEGKANTLLGKGSTFGWGGSSPSAVKWKRTLGGWGKRDKRGNKKVTKRYF